jgi:hypothetical protein
MRPVMSPIQPAADAAMLQMQAERAGLAWACPFSSSDEFEAAVIRAKQRSGAYARKRSRRPMLYTVLAAGVATAIYCVMI